jgi:hypothetical protein
MKGLHRVAGATLDEEGRDCNWLDEFAPEVPPVTSLTVTPRERLLTQPERQPAPQPGDLPLLGEPIDSPRLPPKPPALPPPFGGDLRALAPPARRATSPFLLFSGTLLALMAVIGPDVLFRAAQPGLKKPTVEELARAPEPIAATATTVTGPPAAGRGRAASPETRRPAEQRAAPPPREPGATQRPPASQPTRGNDIVPSASVAAARDPLTRPGAGLDRPAGDTAASPAPPAPAPPPAVSPPAVTTPSTTVPPAAYTPPPVSAPVSAPASASPDLTAHAAQTASVRAVLDRYRQAFTNLDASAVQPFWPGVDGRALERAFDQLESQEFTFDSCQIDLTPAGAQATASCRGRVSLVRKVGSRAPRIEPRQWTFALNRVNDAWMIQSVSSR